LPPLALAPALPTPRRPVEPLISGIRESPAPAEPVWQLVADDTAVTVVSAGAALAEARVSEPDERVVIEFWMDPAGVPGEAIGQLVEQAFARPAVHARRPVLVCVPKRDGAVLAHAHRFVSDAVVRPAGVTCLIEGHVGIGLAKPSALCPAT
jgi:hypothetical protein